MASASVAGNRPLVIDGRNVLSPEDVTSQGFDYVSIGRNFKAAAGSVHKSFAAPAVAAR